MTHGIESIKSIKQNRSLLRNRTFLNRNPIRNNSYNKKSVKKIAKTWEDRKFSKMQRKANLKALRHIIIAMAFMLLGSYFLYNIFGH